MSQGSKLEEYRLYLKETAVNDLYFMASCVLGFRDLEPEVHYEPCMFIQDDSVHDKGWLDPRGFFKSSIIQADVLRNICKDLSVQILYISEIDDNASRCLKFVQQTLENNGLFKWLFPEVKLEQASSQRLRVTRPEAAADDTLVAVGVQSSLASQHYDRLYSDDWFAERAKDSEGARERALEFRRRLVPIRKSVSWHTTTGTRWDHKDGYKWIAENEPDTQWIIRSAVKPDGSALFPSKFPLDKLAAFRRQQGEYLFSCLYMNRPEGESGHRLLGEWLKDYRVEERTAFTEDNSSDGIPLSAMAKYVMVDPSPGMNDEQAYIVWGVWRDDKGIVKYFLLDEDGTKGLSLSGQAKHAIGLAKKWRCIGIGVQQVSESMYLFHQLQEFVKLQKLAIFVRMAKPPVRDRPTYSSMKAQRILNLMEPVASAGNIYIQLHMRMGAWYNQYIKIPLPQSSDDRVDASSLIFVKEDTKYGKATLVFPAPGRGYNDGADRDEDDVYIDPQKAWLLERIRTNPVNPLGAY